MAIEDRVLSDKKNNVDLSPAAFIECCLLKSANVKGNTIVLGNVKLRFSVHKLKFYPRTGHEGPEGM
jgi:hypothetical protein